MKKINWSEKKRTQRYGNVWKEVFIRDEEKCVLCSKTTDLTIDHILSVSKGGKSALQNMRVLCRSCNTKEGHKGRHLLEKNQKKREELRKWAKRHTGYFTEKSKEFRKNNKGYYRETNKKQNILYREALI